MDRGVLQKYHDRFRASDPCHQLGYQADQYSVGCVHRRCIYGKTRAERGNQVLQIRGGISLELRCGASDEGFGRLDPFSRGFPGTHHGFQSACGMTYR